MPTSPLHTQQSSLVGTLPDGPLDVVGDLHGEYDSLRKLLNRLGYSDDGWHPEQRRLVFVGDLTDRGPDSLATVDIVRQLVEQGRGWCVLGNHDLNILRGRRKYDNGWFFGEECRDPEGSVVPQRLASETERRVILRFFETLPLALWRDDLRVVHACWDEKAIRLAAASTDVTTLYERHRDIIREQARREELNSIDEELRQQNANPVKLLTSGPEELAPFPYYTSGKRRYLQRVEWWHGYASPVPCLFGHYSRDASVSRQGLRAICIDFGAYRRRESARPYKLAAVRVPEWEVIFDEGDGFRLKLSNLT